VKKLKEYIKEIKPVSRRLDNEVQAHLDSLTKPPGSLGRLESLVKDYIAITGKNPPSINKKTIFVMAGDHAIAEEGVSAFPAEVTPQMVFNFLSGGAAINVLANHAGCKTKVVDMGVNADFEKLDGLIDRKVRKGARNFAKEEAMTEDELVQAVTAGIELAEAEAGAGVNIIGTGDMGIANTTPSTAIFAELFGIEPETITGAGTGLDGKGISRKASVIKDSLLKHRPFSNPLDVLKKVGGFEIAGITGLIFGSAKRGVPVMIDGFISTAASAVAVKTAPHILDNLFFSHLSNEQGHKAVVEKLGVEPILNLGMRLGEGTGSALAISVVEAGVKIYNEMATFKSAGVADGS